ncbi:hypothetical protein RRG08_047271 [Elysia crispata]|uniref:Uncharacterized protein n=1 Tax=Elysia crispata TaxID=231223 RepID=A0AAE0ZC68_9GAST|nr:hypothetical protein RRG08_047271 [Elysia crispata]
MTKLFRANNRQACPQRSNFPNQMSTTQHPPAPPSIHSTTQHHSAPSSIHSNHSAPPGTISTNQYRAAPPITAIYMTAGGPWPIMTDLTYRSNDPLDTQQELSLHVCSVSGRFMSSRRVIALRNYRSWSKPDQFLEGLSHHSK